MTTGLGFPHNTHCLPDGDIMISSLGTPDGNGEGIRREGGRVRGFS